MNDMIDITYEDYYDLFYSFFWRGKYDLDANFEGMILKAIRNIHKLNQDDLAERIDVTKSFLSTMENGKRPISQTTKQRLALFILERDVKEDIDSQTILTDMVSTVMANTIYGNNWLGADKTIIDIIIKKVKVSSEISNIKLPMGINTNEKRSSYQSTGELSKVISEIVDRALNESRGNSDTGKVNIPNSKKLMLTQSLEFTLNENEAYQDQLINVLHKSLVDISSFFDDIDIIRRYDLEPTLDRIARSLKKLLRDSYNEIHNDTTTIEGYVGAGNPYDFMELGRDTVTIPESIQGNDNFGLIIRGDSMSPSYQDGDLVFVKRQKDLENGQLGVFEIDGKYIFKKYYKDEKGNITLKSINKNYNDIVLNSENCNRLEIIGKVLMSKRNYK